MGGNGVNKVDDVPGAGERERVGALCPAHVEHGRRRRRQEARQQLTRAFGLQAAPGRQPVSLDVLGIVGGDGWGKLHVPSSAEFLDICTPLVRGPDRSGQRAAVCRHPAKGKGREISAHGLTKP